jgi:agmatine deiminase
MGRASRQSSSTILYRMPAEWEPHAATWLAWPHNPTDWPGKFQPIGWVMAEIIRHIARVELVRLLVDDAADEERARRVLMAAHVFPSLEKNVRFHRVPTNRIWLRDSGPIFVRDSKNKLTITDWRFNAWAKYDDWQLDDKVPVFAQRVLELPRVQPEWRGKRVVLEGGSIDVNGAGLMLTTEECLLSDVQQRNPGLSREDIEGVFRQYLGIEKTLWLERGIAGDDTHGHIDDIARFVSADTIVAAYEEDKSDPNHEILHENFERLVRMTDQQGRKLRIVKIPMPAPVWFKNQRLPASYANFYIANELVLVPVFNDPNDRIALNILAEQMPGRKVVGIYCGDFVLGLGTLHCMTQQEPALSIQHSAFSR